LGLHGVFGDHPFHLIAEKPKPVPEKISPRLRILEKILKEISFSDLPAKNHYTDYMRQRYRRNCKPNPMQMTHVIINFRRHLKRRNYSKHTVKYYLNIIKQYVIWLDVPLETATPVKIDMYLYFDSICLFPV